jgi:hypothetical protein
VPYPQHRRPQVRSSRPHLLLVLVALALLAVAAAAAPALGYGGWRHGGATQSSCNASGCHAHKSPSNDACVSCHTGYSTSGGRLCWDCHQPGSAPGVACAGSCHLLSSSGGESFSYAVAFSHGDSPPHLGASGYGKTCVDCHGKGGAHHDATAAQAPACAKCHNGTYAKLPPASHNDGKHGDCAKCHDGMSLPSCAGCHVGSSGSGAPQITFSNSLSCDNASCHGKVKNHAGTPVSQVACTTCHASHFESLGTCTTCHPGPQSFHHATAKAVPLNDCTACHNGSIAAAPSGHQAYGNNCASCHTGMDRPKSDCASCHVGNVSSSAPQVTYSNDLSCDSVACHAKVSPHSGTPVTNAACTACHSAHYASLGACATCHSDAVKYHHAAAKSTPLADCASCHNGSIAPARVAHAGLKCTACHKAMDVPPVPATCRSCHAAATFGDANCLTCHSKNGLTGKETVHAADPAATVVCRACHAPHYADLGGCATCHRSHARTHHATATLRDTALTLTASPARVVRGKKMRVRGSLAGAAPLGRQEVLLQSRTSSAAAFRTVATATTGADGSFAKAFTLRRNTEIRAVWRAPDGAGLTQRPAVALLSVKVVRK